MLSLQCCLDTHSELSCHLVLKLVTHVEFWENFYCNSLESLFTIMSLYSAYTPQEKKYVARLLGYEWTDFALVSGESLLSWDHKHINVHYPALRLSEVCCIKCTNTFSWNSLLYICKVTEVYSWGKPFSLCALAGCLLVTEQQCNLQEWCLYSPVLIWVKWDFCLQPKSTYWAMCNTGRISITRI